MSRRHTIDRYWELLPQGDISRLLDEIEMLLGYLTEDQIAEINASREDADDE